MANMEENKRKQKNSEFVHAYKYVPKPQIITQEQAYVLERTDVLTKAKKKKVCEA